MKKNVEKAIESVRKTWYSLKKNKSIVEGEVSFNAYVDFEEAVKKVLKEIPAEKSDNPEYLEAELRKELEL